MILPALVISDQQFSDILQAPECTYCGMDRNSFSHSRIMLRYPDGHSTGVCSINCAAIDYLKDIDQSPSEMQVADYGTKRLLSAEAAFWVLGGSKRGVMTARAKWAFERKEDALAFIRRYGGELASFEGVMTDSYVDMHEDMRSLARMKAEYARSGTASRHDP
jgi:nitrous oxide reductase accessory protein NosL